MSKVTLPSTTKNVITVKSPLYVANLYQSQIQPPKFNNNPMVEQNPNKKFLNQSQDITPNIPGNYSPPSIILSSPSKMLASRSPRK
jgi:hypothetical protein